MFTPSFFCREVVESGCHPLAYELLCQLAQPVCYKDRLVPPCQAFCQVKTGLHQLAQPVCYKDRLVPSCQDFWQVKSVCISRSARLLQGPAGPTLPDLLPGKNRFASADPPVCYKDRLVPTFQANTGSHQLVHTKQTSYFRPLRSLMTFMMIMMTGVPGLV
jgi:hypothetical protein